MIQYAKFVYLYQTLTGFEINKIKIQLQSKTLESHKIYV